MDKTSLHQDESIVKQSWYIHNARAESNKDKGNVGVNGTQTRQGKMKMVSIKNQTLHHSLFNIAAVTSFRFVTISCTLLTSPSHHSINVPDCMPYFQQLLDQSNSQFNQRLENVCDASTSSVAVSNTALKPAIM